mmetsp:Transcript_1942/g.6974  ORF Transcript_1942/g.6974 Transcript_1942/m.6974 type:complete len:464 (-) Transcript_1942:100-1491(-)|eukprot:CAMPEP_0114607666 /NCGR_PEP_ID=MMETSP0168-20121206/2183_1 /TAXON_ID=95228 ORGANISM="Vannella sp., Strain DIVA3 517/6/12" /NCGR_SAMPLE_ID=MMETSP0168 /ASSEMBLY_ACC=CAM_ASM_000044 /LENGTH=463 /DNA_ID=CAMNT_0001818545 /DNA_START=79 /DNA_END=1470 /DNA_ORIENTATION=+
MISAIATIQDGSCHCVRFEFDETTSWDALKSRLSSALGQPEPFTISYLDDDGEDIPLTAAEWPTSAASAATGNHFLVLNVTPAPPAPAPAAEAAPAQEARAQGRPCGFGGFPGFPMGFLRMPELMGNLGISPEDVQGIAQSFLSGEPLGQEQLQKVATGVSALTQQPEDVVAERVQQMYAKGQDIAAHCQADVQGFAAHARNYAASVAKAAAEAELAAHSEEQSRDEAEAAAKAEAIAKAKAEGEARAAAAKRTRHPARCDVCKKGIVGVRMKCLNCDDYDMCEACESRNLADDLHPDTHVFAKIYKPCFMRFDEPFPNLYETSQRRREARMQRCRASPNGPAACAPHHPLFAMRGHGGYFARRPCPDLAQQQSSAPAPAAAPAPAPAPVPAAPVDEARAAAIEARQEEKLMMREAFMARKKAMAKAASAQQDARLASLEQKLLQLSEALAEERKQRERNTFA